MNAENPAPLDTAVAATGTWIDPDDRYSSPTGVAHAWLPPAEETVCGVRLDEEGLTRFPHLRWADVRPGTGPDADQVQEVCARCAEALG